MADEYDDAAAVTLSAAPISVACYVRSVHAARSGASNSRARPGADNAFDAPSDADASATTGPSCTARSRTTDAEHEYESAAGPRSPAASGGKPAARSGPAND